METTLRRYGLVGCPINVLSTLLTQRVSAPLQRHTSSFGKRATQIFPQLLLICYIPYLVQCTLHHDCVCPSQSLTFTTDFKTAFEQEYSAPKPEILLSTMDLYPLAEYQYHNRSFFVVQSSGMGKSRLMDHSATLRFTLPFNICEQTNGSVESRFLPRVLSVSPYLPLLIHSLPSYRF